MDCKNTIYFIITTMFENFLSLVFLEMFIWQEINKHKSVKFLAVNN